LSVVSCQLSVVGSQDGIGSHRDRPLAYSLMLCERRISYQLWRLTIA
jgi:hypothetical protein